MDLTNRDNHGKSSTRGPSRDLTNRENNGTPSNASKSGTHDLTNAGYGAKAPRSKGFTTVVKNKPLSGKFKGSDTVTSTPRALNIRRKG
jgi:hypothetical protein